MDTVAETLSAYRAFADGRHAEAAELARRVLRRVPTDPGALTLLGRLALASGEPDVAHHTFSRVLDSHPRTAALWVDLARALQELARPELAADAAERSVTLDPGAAAAWLALGEIRLSLDEREEAARAFRRALALRPDCAKAFRGVCVAEDVSPGSELVRHAEALAGRSELAPSERAQLHYALAHVHRRAAEKERFVHHLLEANAIQRKLCSGGRAEYAATFDRLESAFTKEAFAAAPRADPSEPAPIFVLGMPRSGTTLVERLLAAHPDVAAGGELNYMRGPLRRAVEQATGRTFPEGFETIPGDLASDMARAYARRLALVGQGSRLVTDKTPGNFHLLGLLRTLWPRGKVVHVARDPMDTCFSILQHPFDDRSPHTCDMELLAYAHARYVGLMAHWRKLFGDEFHTVEYERLVAAPSEEARRIFAHCGLDWDDAYLDSQGSARGVRTFSVEQVRRPIYTSSVGAWRPFSEALAPLRAALERELPGYAA